MAIDPFDRLFSKDDRVDTGLLAELLLPYIRIDPDSGRVRFTEDGHQLTVKKKVVVYLLARKAFAVRNSKASEVASPKEISTGIGAKGGTVRPKIKELLEERLIEESDAGYAVPTHSLQRAKQYLESA